MRGTFPTRPAWCTFTGLVALGLLSGCSAFGADEAGDDAGADTERVTATVTKTDLTETTTASGQLEYGEARDLAAVLPGTVTWLPKAGAVIDNGEALYRVDTEPVVRLDGAVPAWRDLGPDVSDGRDVRQLERALRALGHTDDLDLAVDGDWTWVTTIAVERWQEDLGVEETGMVPLGSVVFTPGQVRVADRLVDVGSTAQPGVPVLQVGEIERSVTVSLETTQKYLAPLGGRVTLQFPDGTSVRGRIEEVEHVAGDETTEESLAVTVAVVEEEQARKRVAEQIDGTSVQVEFSHTVAEDILAVPVTALLALANGGYGVERVAGDSTEYVPVTPGSFSDTSVEIAEGDLAAGDDVVVTP